MALTRETILAADDMPREEVETPEWGGSVYVRGMTGIERDQLEASIVQPDGTRDIRHFVPRVVALCVVDEHGKPVFSFADSDALNAKSPIALKRVFDSAARLSGLRMVDAEASGGN